MICAGLISGSAARLFTSIKSLREAELHQTTMLCDESGLIPATDFDGFVFSEGQHHKQLRPAIKLDLPAARRF